MNTETPSNRPDGPHPIGLLRDRAIGIIAFATVLGLLYVGRSVLIPFSLALMLSLLIAPIIRRLRHLGLGQTTAVLVSVLSLALMVAAATAVLGTQVLRMAAAPVRKDDTGETAVSKMN